MTSLRHWFRAGRARLLLVALTLLQACGEPEETPLVYESIPTQFIANPEAAVDPTAVPTADDTRTYFHVFRSQAEWATWWERVNEKYDPQPLPAIDFSGNTVAGVYLGMRSNGCFALRIQQVVERDGAIIVRYHEIKPGAGDTCSAAVVYPLKLIRIQATGLPIQFVAV